MQQITAVSPDCRETAVICCISYCLLIFTPRFSISTCCASKSSKACGNKDSVTLAARPWQELLSSLGTGMSVQETAAAFRIFSARNACQTEGNVIIRISSAKLNSPLRFRDMQRPFSVTVDALRFIVLGSRKLDDVFPGCRFVDQYGEIIARCQGVPGPKQRNGTTVTPHI